MNNVLQRSKQLFASPAAPSHGCQSQRPCIGDDLHYLGGKATQHGHVDRTLNSTADLPAQGRRDIMPNPAADFGSCQSSESPAPAPEMLVLGLLAPSPPFGQQKPSNMLPFCSRTLDFRLTLACGPSLLRIRKLRLVQDTLNQASRPPTSQHKASAPKSAAS